MCRYSLIFAIAFVFLRGLDFTPTESGEGSENSVSYVPTKAKKACQDYKKTLHTLPPTYQILIPDVQVGEFPHMVALFFWSEIDQVYRFDCSGTLISDRYILTAAHCIVNLGHNQLKFVRIGKVELSGFIDNPDPKIDFNVVSITVHPQFNWRTKVNDIALVKLEKKVNFTDFVRPACLYTENDDPPKMVVTCWQGDVNFGDRTITKFLQRASSTAVPLQKCNSTYYSRANRTIIKSQICASHDQDEECVSGAPIQIMTESSVWDIVGITSHGLSRWSNYPVVYSRIYSYLSWIEGIVWP